MVTVTTGVVRRVSGPLVEVDGLPAVAVDELLELGPDRIPVEVIAVRDDVVTAQAYEYTGGLAPGMPAMGLGEPLSARLGPHLLRGVFDGLLRPLSTAPAFLRTGATTDSISEPDRDFEPTVHVGSTVYEGQLLGVVAAGVEYRVLVPPGVSGTVTEVHPGRHAADDTVAVVGETPVRLAVDWPVRRPRPYRARRTTVEPLHTGQRGVDLLFPILRGATAMVPGGFGTGKTVLLQQLAKWCDADVIVYVGCGERGNEMADVVAELFSLTDPRTGGTLADRTVVIANTSNMPMMAREASIYTGITVAEHFRDMGYHTVVIADSTSRWAEALRELASRTGALPAEEGYPANLASALAAFYERAGTVETLGGRVGSVTVVGAVSPPGGDMTEPVTAHTERFVRCRWTLDRELAYARHYPAVSWSASFALDTDAIAACHAAEGDPDWATRRATVVRMLAEADRLAVLAELVGVTGLPDTERVALLAGRLLRQAVLQQNALSTVDAASTEARTAALVDATLAVVRACQAAVAAGTPAATVEDLDFGPLVRAREECPPGEDGAIAARRDRVLSVVQGMTP